MLEDKDEAGAIALRMRNYMKRYGFDYEEPRRNRWLPTSKQFSDI